MESAAAIFYAVLKKGTSLRGNICLVFIFVKEFCGAVYSKQEVYSWLECLLKQLH